MISSVSPRNRFWLLVGDFNAITGAYEIVGGRQPNSSCCLEFANMILENNLQEVITKRASVIWYRLSSRGFIECKLD